MYILFLSPGERTKDEYEESRLLTSTHYESLSWNMIECPDLCPYSVVVFYDQDGTAAANVLSVLHRAFKALKQRQVGGWVGTDDPNLVWLQPCHYVYTQIEDVFIILGGFSSISSRFPHLVHHLRPPPPRPLSSSSSSSFSSRPPSSSVCPPPPLPRPSPPSPPSPSPPPPLRGIIPWMPTLVRSDRLFLGRHEQAEAHTVVCGLGITHLLSIGRWVHRRG